MKSSTTRNFWRMFDALPLDVQARARTAFELWRHDASHPSLQFKRVDSEQPIYSVRIGLHYRALGLLRGDTVNWFWIGSHDAYDRLLS